MTKNDEKTVSRRTLFQFAAVGTGFLLGGFVPAAHATAAPRSATLANSREIAGMGTFLDIDGVRAEYRKAIAKFPLTLPVGWSFPPESKQQDSEPGVRWEKGNGEAEAYFFWQYAVATAAHEAHLQGDAVEANRLLDALEAGYLTPTRRAVIDDPEAVFVAEAIQPARGANAAARGTVAGGDFGPLMNVVAP